VLSFPIGDLAPASPFGHQSAAIHSQQRTGLSLPHQSQHQCPIHHITSNVITTRSRDRSNAETHQGTWHKMAMGFDGGSHVFPQYDTFMHFVHFSSSSTALSQWAHFPALILGGETTLSSANSFPGV
jgi:hypothetical protein